MNVFDAPRRLLGRIARPASRIRQVSSGYAALRAGEDTRRFDHEWQRPEIAARQGALVRSELADLYEGRPPMVYTVAAQAVNATGLDSGGRIVEIGCASGYYSRVLEQLLGRRIDYVGVDYSAALLNDARREYPGIPVVQGDACALPLANRAAPVVVSGGVLLHLSDYERAIRETARVAASWVIFHRTPVVDGVKSLAFTKRAYGVEVMERAFSRSELFRHFSANALAVESSFSLGRSRLPGTDDEVEIVTYVCRRLTVTDD